jgi:ParB family transcriptional regulator, chromosome partitioning protein
VKHKALGKGLSALIPDKPVDPAAQIHHLPLDAILPGKSQQRRNFGEESLQQLAHSVREQGVILPVIVRPAGTKYELIAGERRLRAAKIANLPTIPAIIKRVTDSTALEIALIENLQREDLNAIESASGYKLLVDEYGLTQESLASKIGKDRATIANAIRLLKLPAEILDLIRANELSAGHAKALLALRSKNEILHFADTAITNHWSVRTLEHKIQVFLSDHSEQDSPSEPDPILDQAIDLLRRRLSTKIRVKKKKQGGGIISLEYYSDEDLIRLLELLGATDRG